MRELSQAVIHPELARHHYVARLPSRASFQPLWVDCGLRLRRQRTSSQEISLGYQAFDLI
jgi:hypothetical protein